MNRQRNDPLFMQMRVDHEAGRATPRAIAEALMSGEIPHVQVVL